MCASVELKGWFRRVNFKMNLALWVIKGCQLLQRFGPGVNGDIAGIGVDHEAVVDSRLLLAQSKRLLSGDTREIFNGSLGNEMLVNHKILGRLQCNLCTSDSGVSSEIKVT